MEQYCCSNIGFQPIISNRVAATGGYIERMQPLRPFTQHPASVGESYLEHLVTAISFGVRLLVAGIACVVHGVLPFLFVRTGSRAVTELNERMVAKRRGSASAAATENRIPL